MTTIRFAMVSVVAILATAFFSATLSTRYGDRMRSELDRSHVIPD
jgi:hypothetical protein